jgi:hypothetical protein
MERSKQEIPRLKIASYIFFIISLVAVISTSACDIGTGPQLPAQLVNLKISSMKLVTQIPSPMNVKQSYVVRVSLVSALGATTIATLVQEKPTLVVGDTSPIGTPDATLLNAFGLGYEPSATATLDASAFTVIPANDTAKPQSLRQPEVHWDWNVTPLYTGTQIITVRVWIQWIRIQSGGAPSSPTPAYSIGETPNISVSVRDPNEQSSPLLDVGTTINTAVPAVLSSLCVSLITWLVLKLWPEKQKEEQSMPLSGKQEIISANSTVNTRSKRSKKRKAPNKK